MTLQLELLSHLPRRQSTKPAVLFVHGAFAGAWIWKEYFLPYFAGQGYAAHAVSLRGHGGSEGHESLPWSGLSDFVADLRQVVADLGTAPILVGHSMGGMVVQKYLECASVPAAILMASVPPGGLLGCSLWLAINDPLLFQEMNLIQWGGPHFATVQVARRAIFSPGMPDAQVAKYFKYLQAESQRVVVDMSGFDLPKQGMVLTSPILILGGERDALIPPTAIESTASAFGTQAKIFPHMAHAMMLEAGWRDVVEHILTWLQEQGL